MAKLSMNLDKPGAAGEVAGTGGTYEFDRLQNETILQLSRAMKFVGVITIVLGVLYSFGVVVSAYRSQLAPTVVAAVQAVIHFVLGSYLLTAAASFQHIVTTRGADIPNLMGGLDQLRRFFALQRLLYIIIIVVLASGFLLLLVSKA